MKMAVIYHSVTGNTKNMGNLIVKGMSSIEGVEAQAFPIEAVDAEFVKEATCVVFGSPIYAAHITGQMMNYLLSDAGKLNLAGKLVGAYATAQYVHGGAELGIREMLDQMSLEQRVGQLFLARCDGEYALAHIDDYQLGGFVLFGEDFDGETPESMKQKLAAYQTAAKIPMLMAVDEEGGTVCRVSSHKAFRSRRFASPRQLFREGGTKLLLSQETEKCALLQSLGINVNLGPVCDITTDPAAFLYERSLGQQADITSDYVVNVVTLMDSYGIGSCLKHFPGYGNNADTHIGIARDSRSLAALEDKDLIPFAAGITAGADAILVSHTIVECFDPETPASLSPAVHRYLREEMGFDGVILTDDLIMEAITDTYGAEEAAVQAVLAGNDLLCSSEYTVQYEAVLDAVLEGRISIDVLNAAVRNVLQWKIDLGLI